MNKSTKKTHRRDIHKDREICDNKSVGTVSTLLPKWCDNISDNMDYIKKYGLLSSLVCKTYPKCWKMSKLTELFQSHKEYPLDEACNICKLSIKGIEQGGSIFLSKNLSFSGSAECVGCDQYIQQNKPALIIGGGPSLDTYNHLKLLKKHGFKGDTFCVSSIIKKVLDSGNIPNYVGSIDAEEQDTSFIDYEIVHNNSDKITGLFGITIHPTTNEKFKGNRKFFSGHIDNEVIPNISYLFQLLTKAPLVNTGGNVGSSLIAIASILGYNPIILIGMDLSFPSFEEMKRYFETTIHTWDPYPVKREWTEDKYKRETNPSWNKQYYIDPVFESYAISTLWILKGISLKGVNIINCTEQGALFGKHITSMRFEEYLKTQP